MTAYRACLAVRRLILTLSFTWEEVGADLPGDSQGIAIEEEEEEKGKTKTKKKKKEKKRKRSISSSGGSSSRL